MLRSYENPRAEKCYQAVCEDLSLLPFVFTYGNQRFCGFSKEEFELLSQNTETEGGKTTTKTVFRRGEALTVTLVLSHYPSHGVTEWTVWFENPSEEPSLLLEDPHVELSFEGEHPVLRGILGDHLNQYSPYGINLNENPTEFYSTSGRATHINFPYFNLEYGDGGVMLAIGWAGTWRASFASEGTKTLYQAASVVGMKTYLKPHEKIRTALFAVAPYSKREEHYATNYWRSWFVRWNLPKADGKGTPLAPFSTACLASDTGRPNSDGSISECCSTWRPSLEKMLEYGVKVDFRWLDAGWYVCPDGSSAQPYVKGHDWWDTVGTWELDPAKWPEGSFRESTDFAREHGMKTLVWFEPERVTDVENLVKRHGYQAHWAIQLPQRKTISNNIGDPECFEWTVERICKMLRDNKVEMYREDNNCNAAELWAYLDEREGEGRLGITECKFIEAHYRMWDRIIACTGSYGGCAFVDSCASGGGRNDLESMRRGVPLLRSDSDRTSTALRLSMTTSLNKWIPFNGACTGESAGELDAVRERSVYIWRASYLCCLNTDRQYVQGKGEGMELERFGLREWDKVKPYLLQEFYPLTPWHKEKDVSDFTAFSYWDPQRERGLILAFRQERCTRDTLNLTLPFAAASWRLCLVDEDTRESREVEKSFSLHFAAPKSARLLWLEKI